MRGFAQAGLFAKADSQAIGIEVTTSTAACRSAAELASGPATRASVFSAQHGIGRSPPSWRLSITETREASSATVLAVLLSLVFVPCADAQSFWIDRVAGNPDAADDGIPAMEALLVHPTGVAVDRVGNLYIADAGDHRIRKVDAAGTITTVAGTGIQSNGVARDGEPANNAELSYPWALALDTSRNLYIADSGNHLVRRVDAAGTITTIAGTGGWGFSGDGRSAVNAQLAHPEGIALDASGNLYIADTHNHRVRRVDVAGTITTIAGTGGRGFSGDGRSAVNAQLDYPQGVALDASGNLYIADAGNHRVRRVDVAGTISTIAGTGDPGFSGDGGPAVNAQLARPKKVALDTSGNLYIADTDNHRIRRVDAAGTITTIGGGNWGASGDCGPASAAEFEYPEDVAVDHQGALFVTSRHGRTVRKLSVTAPERCRTPHATLSEWTVSPGRVVFGGTASTGCLALAAPVDGTSYLVHTSEWQRRAPGASAWSTVGGTLRTGRLCAFEPTEPGQYRAVAEISVGSRERAAYRSANEVSGSYVPADSEPSFGTASIGDQSFVSGTAISPLTLPSASGGDLPLAYSLHPTVPGLTFSPTSRTLSGTPSSVGGYVMTYTAMDADGDTDTLNFTLSVAAGSPAGGGGGAALPTEGSMAGNFDLDRAHFNSRGIAYANNRFYFFNWLRRMVFAYTGTGQRDPDKDFDVVGIIVGPLHRFAYTNGRFYIFDSLQGRNGGKLFAYTVTGQRDAQADLDLGDGNFRPRGIVYAAGRFYVLDSRKVFAYTASGTRDAQADFDLGDDNFSPTGIVYAAGRFYVLDSSKVFAYTGAGARDAAADFALGCGTGSAIGIAYANGGFHVLNYISRKVYTYAGTSGNTSPCFSIGSSPSRQTYTVGTPISTLTLPAARGGDGPLVYSLQPDVPGLAFSSRTRQLSGTPTSTGTYSMRYSVRDSDGDTATLDFTLIVRSSGGTAGAKRYSVDDSITTLPTGFWTPDVTSGGSFQYSAGAATVRLNNGGYIEEGDYRYTCASSAGCEVVNGTVTKGVVVESTTGESVAGDDSSGGDPDLVVAPPSVSDTSLSTGERFTLRATVRNDGAGDAAATALHYYRSRNSTISSSDTRVGTDSVGRLAAAATSAESIRLTAPSSAGTYYYGACVDAVANESDTANNCSSSVAVTVADSGGGTEPPPSGGNYTPLDDWTVSDGRVQFLFFSAGRCVQLGNTTINGVTYTIHSSKWQKRANSTSAWVDISGTAANGAVCSYSPTDPGQYRGVAEISIGGRRGRYATKNILTVP